MQVYPKCITLHNFPINHSAAASKNKTTSVKLCCNNHEAFGFRAYRIFALRMSCSRAPKSSCGLASSDKDFERLSIHKLVAYTPMATLGSPFSIRIRVGMETFIRAAQVLSDSFLRNRPMAKSAPKSRKPLSAAAGNVSIAPDALDTTQLLSV